MQLYLYWGFAIHTAHVVVSRLSHLVCELPQRAALSMDKILVCVCPDPGFRALPGPPGSMFTYRYGWVRQA